jgi:four helix bundle protein
MATRHVVCDERLRVHNSVPSDRDIWIGESLRRAAVSVPSNIAEGKGRRSRREYVQFLYHARGSLFEVETQLEIAFNLNYIGAGALSDLQTELSGVARVLNGLIHAMERRSNAPDTSAATKQ